MMISCEKAALICNKAQYNEASFMDKLKLKFHIFLCKTCAGFTKKNTQFTSLCDKAKLRSLTEQDKAKMRQELNKGQ